ncbi:glycosyltransferase [Facklamia sp. DSM 111018]|uniref:Glycosyltransferase n=2 Tax=Facklamia lactis TaxID=2749967 RepID=A0ABS0LN30_9LACT|nr:glycosyltransferase [Facklamia lactis]MBG9979953.1 glycosyltransferase [Facklamia lactis]MBG9985367.1 glycosyltransferase [Facklamia lactis]
MNRAGMENRLMDIYKNIDRTQIQFDFYTLRETAGEFDEEIKALGGKVFYNKPMNIVTMYSSLRNFNLFLIKNKEYKIVHCHLNQWSGLMLGSAKRAGILTRIAHSRTSLEGYSLKNIIKNIVKIPVNYTATHKFAVSYKAGVWLYGARAMKNSKVKILPNAIKMDDFHFDNDLRITTRKKLNISGKFVMIHVGNIKPEKNHLFLLEIFEKVLIRNKHAILLIVGKDHMNGIVKKKAKELKLNNVYFLGSRTDICELLNAADVFVFPSKYEGFPGSVVEAQCTGLSCYISDRITSEVILSDLVETIPLTAKPEEWADIIINKNYLNRKDMVPILKNTEYDVERSAELYKRFYLLEMRIKDV